MRFPSISAVAAELRAVNREKVTDWDGMDVRLQVYEDGNWAVRFGDASYDTDHHGYWGSASVPGNGDRFNSKEVAEDLIDQVKEQWYEEHGSRVPMGGENPNGGGLSTAETAGLVVAGVAVLGAIGYFVFKSPTPAATTAANTALSAGQTGGTNGSGTQANPWFNGSTGYSSYIDANGNTVVQPPGTQSPSTYAPDGTLVSGPGV